MDLYIKYHWKEGYNYTFVYSTHHRLRYYRWPGKSYPRTTICEVYFNDDPKPVWTAEVVKHDKDPDSVPYGLRAVTKKILQPDRFSKGSRTIIWRMMDKMIADRVYYSEEHKMWLVKK